MASAPATSPAGSWLSLGPASRMVGVGPETLRRWADEGLVESFVTPGGHRRFSRRALDRLVRDARPAPASLARLGATSERLTAAYRRRYAATTGVRTSGRLVESRAATGDGHAATGDGHAATGDGRAATGDGHVPSGDRLVRTMPPPALDPRRVVPPAERETFRVEGRQLIEALLRHLDARDASAADAALAQASALVQALAVRLARAGVGLTDAVTLFVAARRPFLAELAAVGRRRTLDSGQLAGLYENASVALDRLLVVLVQSHRTAAQEKSVHPHVIPSRAGGSQRSGR